MLTAGFDVVAELHKDTIDKALAVAFYSSVKEFVVGEVNGIDYKIQLKEPPVVDIFTDDVVRLSFYLEIGIKRLGLNFELDLKALADAKLDYDSGSKKLIIDVESVDVAGIGFGDRRGWLQIFSWKIRLPDFLLNWLNEIIRLAIGAGILDEYKTFEVAPLLQGVDIPYVTPAASDSFTFEVAGFKSFDDKTMAVPVNFGIPGRDNAGRGNEAGINDFSDGSDLCIGLSAEGMKDFFDFWWENTTWEKEYPLVDEDKKLDYPYEDVLETLDMLPIDLTYNLDCFIDYNVTVSFGKPDWDLKDNDEIVVTSLPITLNGTLEVKIVFEILLVIDGETYSVDVIAGILEALDTILPIPNPLTNASDPTVIVPQIIPNLWVGNFDQDWIGRYTIARYDIEDLPVQLNDAKVSLELDPGNQFVATLESVDVDVNRDWVREATMGLMDDVNVSVPEKSFEWVLNPPILSGEIPELGVTAVLDMEILSTHEREAVIGGDFSVPELTDRWPVPTFIAGDRPFRSEVDFNIDFPFHDRDGIILPSGVVHRSDCLLVNDLFEKYKRGFYSITDALNKGYTACPECLPEYTNL